MWLGTLDASFLVNMLTRKSVVRAGKGIVRAGKRYNNMNHMDKSSFFKQCWDY